jgi:hypothetical protein
MGQVPTHPSGLLYLKGPTRVPAVRARWRASRTGELRPEAHQLVHDPRLFRRGLVSVELANEAFAVRHPCVFERPVGGYCSSPPLKCLISTQGK